MPIFDYKCEECAHEEELLILPKETPVEVCPKCGSTKFVRLVSAPTFVLKGGGWYKDLYGSTKNAVSGDSSKS